MEIIITDNKNEMINIGQKLFEENKRFYSDAVLNIIRESINQHRPNLGSKDFEEEFFLSIYNYWAYGVVCDEYFYYDFKNKTHEEKKKYMTYRVRMIYGDHLNDSSRKHLLMNKFETYNLFKNQYMRDVILCKTLDDYPAFLDFTDKHPVFVVKPTDMGGGRGVHKASVLRLNDQEKKKLFLSLLAESINNKAKYLKGKEVSIVLEELIDQSDEIGVFNPQSVNGVRINTLLVGNNVIVFEPWLKIGRGGNFLTSAVFGTMDAGINPDTGIVDTFGFTENGDIFELHPDNNIRIKGFKIPRWKEAIDLAKECAKKIPFFRYVAWDLALSKKGWCIMEANYNGDFMWQLYRQKGMKEDFERMIGWKSNKSFWWK